MFRQKFKNPSKIFFTSDLHFYHKNLCKGVSKWTDTTLCREFSSVEDMNDQIIKIINLTVGEDDWLWHLGDWSFQGRKTPKLARDRIKCRNICHVFGNHCYNIRGMENEKLFSWVGDYCEIIVDGHLVNLSHYPIRSWNDQRSGSVHLHGHCHGKIDRLGRSLDVGWDVWGRPLSFSEILNELTGVLPHTEGHH